MNHFVGSQLLARGATLALWLAAWTSAGSAEIPFGLRIIDAQPPDRPWVKIVGDFDGDGLLDVAIGGSKGPLVWYANPRWKKETIAEGGYRAVDGEAADMDGDGDLDVVMGGVVWYENPRPAQTAAKGGWPAHEIGRHEAHDVEVGDLDGDGKMDVASRDQSGFGSKAGNQIWVWRQRDPTRWDSLRINCPHGEGLRLSDLDRDGDLDIVIAARWYENRGAVAERKWPEHVFTRSWEWEDAKVDVGDLNQDGRPDVVLTPAEYKGGSYHIAWFEGPSDPKGENWKQHIIDDPIETVVHALGVADMNLDGNLDVVAASMHQGRSPQQVSLYTNDGRGHKWTKQVLATTGSHNIVLADFERDGDIDVLGANHGGSRQHVELWENLLRGKRP